MSILKISEKADPNYLVTIVKCPKITPHPNAERLELVEIFGNTVVIGKGAYTENQVLAYFPIECCISPKFLSHFNLFDKEELNNDGKTKSYFNLNARVKPIKLRGIASQGFLFKVSELAKYYEIKDTVFGIGDVFDMVGSDILVKKYQKGDSKSKTSVSKNRVPKWVDKTISIFPKIVRRKCYLAVNYWYNKGNESIAKSIVDGQWHFHYDTENIGRNVWLIKPNDYITISSKIHGSNAVYSNILCKKPFNLIRYIFNKFGMAIPNEEYKFCYSSRNVLKNRKNGKFPDDIWGIHAKEIEDKLSNGYSAIGEILGYMPSGKGVQKDYDYGVIPGNSEFWVFRMTETSPDGTVRELGWHELKECCDIIGLKTVPVYYEGLAQDVFADLIVDDNWSENFLLKLKDKYLDKTCELCTRGVVREGIVIRNESKSGKTALKYKSPLFNLAESKARDSDKEENVDDFDS